ncbi:MAG: ATP phosphoribosyltransferase [Gemmatimonadetes bacterium]|nr:ATP phosphoribosyltransferase [Gemmatimonadota bacterium]
MLRIALPNKGRLAEEARSLFDRAGLYAEFREGRSLVASVGPGLEALFVRAQDIPEFVADGAADVGVTGLDLIRELDRAVDELLDLEFGRCRLVVAVTEDSGIRDAAQIAAGTRVATSFPRLALAFFHARMIPVEIVPVSGATEIAPHLGVAAVVVDLVSTGSTLRVNGLREVATIVESTARLVANPGARHEVEKGRTITELVAALESVIRAEHKRYLMANVPRAALDRVKDVLPGISGPTIVDIMDHGEMVAAHSVVDASEVYRTIARLKELGAEGILVTRIERLMP